MQETKLVEKKECLEKYADEIAFHFVFPVPAEARILVGTSFCCLGRFWVFGLERHQYTSSLLRSAASCVLLLLPRFSARTDQPRQIKMNNIRKSREKTRNLPKQNLPKLPAAADRENTKWNAL
ncbi:hypothetical protein V6N13_124794 [Hibiscus sabdariffa]|uniref:Uncharacterized protein n=1 Tax=Hibiscus sabdariffa TaxID=183260 RepID=A0ABR2U410_9ROSI